MNSFVTISVLVVLGFVESSLGENAPYLACYQKQPQLFEKWRSTSKSCMKLMEEQVQMEMRAAIEYLSMAAHFSQYDVNRPGFAKFFFESASEERQHAIKLLEYMLMRGRTGFKNVEPLDYEKIALKEIKPIQSGAHALETALMLESNVTSSIRNIIKTCESPDPAENSSNDYHLVDYLTGDFLTEQYQGQRDLAGKFMTLQKMMHDQKSLGEFLFDKKLLSVAI